MSEVYRGSDRGLRELLPLLRATRHVEGQLAILRGIQEAAYRAGVEATVLRLSKKRA